MQVISRQKGESVVVGDDIVVTVIEIQGDQVRLGIEIPKEIPVHKREVFEAIRQSNSGAD